MKQKRIQIVELDIYNITVICKLRIIYLPEALRSLNAAYGKRNFHFFSFSVLQYDYFQGKWLSHCLIKAEIFYQCIGNKYLFRFFRIFPNPQFHQVIPVKACVRRKQSCIHTAVISSVVKKIEKIAILFLVL